MKRGLVIAALLIVVMSIGVNAQFPELSVQSDSITDKVSIKWTTSIITASSLEINNKVLVFGPLSSFSHEEHGLSPGKAYKYSIVACNESYCTSYKSSIQTEENAAAVTGNIITDLETTGAGVYYFLVALLGLSLLFISYRASQPDFRIKYLLANSERHIKIGRHEKAAHTYKQALGIYRKLSSPEKSKSYGRLVSIYNSLSLKQKQKEAKELAEKYTKGEIKQEELERLRQLLSE